MELLCIEGERVIRAESDPVIMSDDRVLEKLLASEDRYVVTCNYFRYVQKEITPGMRKVCVSWMMEVCEEEHCEDSVFPMAVNYLDRFLSIVDIKKTHLQLLGCVCLLMASKVRQTTPLSARRLVYYTDYTYEYTDVLMWEILVLGRLKWDVAAVIPLDFLDLLLVRLPLGPHQSIVRKHSLVFLQLCTAEFKFCSWTASLVALGCVGAAINGLPNVRCIWDTPQDLVSTFQEITAIESNMIDHCVQQVEEQIAVHVLEALQQSTPDRSPASASASAPMSIPVTKNEQFEEDSYEQKPETPTDILDVII